MPHDTLKNLSLIALFSVFVSAVAVTVGVLPAGVAAELRNPSGIQARIDTLVIRDATLRLRAASDQYNLSLESSSALLEMARKTGMTRKSDVQDLARYVKAAQFPFPKAVMELGAVVIRAEGYTITAGADEFLNQTLKINGRVFKWNWNEAIPENLKRYDSFFEDHENAAQDGLPSLFNQAFAASPSDSGEDTIRIKAAGLQLYFTISAIGDIGGELYRLNALVKKQVTMCETPAAPQGEHDYFFASVMTGALEYRKHPDTILFRNCADIENYAKKPVGKDSQSNPIYPHVPADLCRNFDRLSKCLRLEEDPSAMDSEHKQKKSTDSEEWYEPTQPASKPLADPAQ